MMIEYKGRLRNRRDPVSNSKTDILKKLRALVKKDAKDLSEEEKQYMLKNEDFAQEIQKRRSQQNLIKTRLLEIEDEPSVVIKQCHKLAEALSKSNHAIVYTGAGVSTSANIPDFRGTSGIWTKLNAGKCIKLEQNLTCAVPTTTHMCLKELHDKGIIKHIVSQNCDGLHLRSGIPPQALSEVHGNMYVEVCIKCNEQIHRIFDVTKDTSLRRHSTERKCLKCKNQLQDTIVHFGERSRLRWPHNWEGAVEHAEKADLILCLGSSLKVLRSYKQLWLSNRRKNKRPALYIVNLQWTPKDSQAVMKIRGRVDFVMETVNKALQLSVPTYSREYDPIYKLAEPFPTDGTSLPIHHKFEKKFASCSVTRIQGHGVFDVEPKFDIGNDGAPPGNLDVKDDSETGVRDNTLSWDVVPNCEPERTGPEGGVTSSNSSVPAWFGKGIKSRKHSSKRNRKRRKMDSMKKL